MKSRALRRHRRVSAIRRKSAIARKLYGADLLVRGKLSKGKIHCSCWMCSQKSNVHGLTHADLKALGRDSLKLREYMDY